MSLRMTQKVLDDLGAALGEFEQTLEVSRARRRASAFAINNQGQIAGEAGFGDRPLHVFLWTPTR